MPGPPWWVQEPCTSCSVVWCCLSCPPVCFGFGEFVEFLALCSLGEGSALRSGPGVWVSPSAHSQPCPLLPPRLSGLRGGSVSPSTPSPHRPIANPPRVPPKTPSEGRRVRTQPLLPAGGAPTGPPRRRALGSRSPGGARRAPDEDGGGPGPPSGRCGARPGPPRRGARGSAPRRPPGLRASRCRQRRRGSPGPLRRPPRGRSAAPGPPFLPLRAKSVPTRPIRAGPSRAGRGGRAATGGRAGTRGPGGGRPRCCRRRGLPALICIRYIA